MRGKRLSSLLDAAGSHKKRTAVIAVAVLALLVLVGTRMGGKKGPPAMMAGAPANNVVTVSAEQPQPGTIEESSSTSGTVEASDVVYVYAKASGDVTSIQAGVGDMVEAGQLLMTIDTEQVESAKNSMDAAAVSLSEAQSNVNRMQLLYQSGDISQQEWEQYQNAAKTAQLNYSSAKLNYERQVEYSQITAPISGKIESLDLDVYDRVNQQDQLCVISGEGEKRVAFYVTERIVTNLNQGDAVTIEKNGKAYEGTITDVSTMAEEGSGLFKIRASLPQAGALATGTTVKITVISDRAENVMTVPVDAIYYDGGVGNVYLYEDGTVHKVEVEVGLYDNERAQILSGLSGDELVISTWSSQLYEGSTVNLRGDGSEQNGGAPGTEEGGAPENGNAPEGGNVSEDANVPEGGNAPESGMTGTPESEAQAE